MVFESNDLQEISTKIDSDTRELAEDEIKISKADRNEKIPLSYSQQRLWFLDQLKPNDPTYNIPTVLRLKGDLNLELFENAFNLIVEKHEILRTSFQQLGGKPYQKIKSELRISFNITEISGDSISERIENAKLFIEEKSAEAFNLSQLPLIKCEVIKIDKNDHIFLILMHHIITDGWSLSILIREFVKNYNDLQNNFETES